MRKLILFVVFPFLMLSAHAQSTTLQHTEEEDTTISVIGYFCKNDTLEYRRIQGKDKIVDNDTTHIQELTERFMIVVNDSTSDGYKMELIPVSCEYEGNDSNLLSRLPLLIWDDYKKVHCHFTTDEMGSVKSIDNWREIRDMLKTCYKTVFDSLYTTVPRMDSIMPRKNLENLLLLGSSTQDGVKEQYDELELLFGCHGLVFQRGKSESDEMSEAGYPTHFHIEAFESPQEDEYDLEGDYAVLSRSDTSIPAEDTADLLSSTLGVLFSGDLLTDSITSSVKDLFVNNTEGLKVTRYQLFEYFFNGWPKLMRDIVETRIGDTACHIKYDIIEWTSHHWNMFASPEEEDNGQHF